MIFLFPRWDMLVPWRVFIFMKEMLLTVSISTVNQCLGRVQGIESGVVWRFLVTKTCMIWCDLLYMAYTTQLYVDYDRAL